jgi:predicted DNA-binding transcriptional regulator AlpA
MFGQRRLRAGEPQARRAFPSEGFVRLKAVLAPEGPIPVSKSTWWAGVASGRYPKPIKLGPRITAWRAEEIRALMEDGTDER